MTNFVAYVFYSKDVSLWLSNISIWYATALAWEPLPAQLDTYGCSAVLFIMQVYVSQITLVVHVYWMKKKRKPKMFFLVSFRTQLSDTLIKVLFPSRDETEDPKRQ